MRHNDKLDLIEKGMDSCQNLAEFLEIVAEICSAKADHLEEAWQDTMSAEIYNRHAAAILEINGQVTESFM